MKCFFQLNKSVFIRYITNTISIDDIIEFDYSIIDFASKKKIQESRKMLVCCNFLYSFFILEYFVWVIYMYK